MSRYKGIENAAKNIIEICNEFLENCNDEIPLDKLESIYQKLARQEYDIRTSLNSMALLPNKVQCPNCKSEDIDIGDYDEYLEIMRCTCRECGEFFTKSLE